MMLLALLFATSLTATDPDLDAVKELYAAAAFDDALARLDRIDIASLDGHDVPVAQQYRAACLMALGRSAEAEQTMEALVRNAPELTADRLEDSPRLRSMFSLVRARVLPDVVQELYAAAKRAYSEKNADAAARFERVRRLLDDPALGTGPAAPTLADLRTVVDGFVDLTRTSPPPSVIGPAAPVAPTGGAPSASAAPAAEESSRAFYTSADPNVTAPRTIRQTVPRPPVGDPRLAFAGEAAVQVTIATDGRVEKAVITHPLHPIYDALLLAAAKRWRYEPATLQGRPIRFIKTVLVNVTRDDREPSSSR